MSLDQTKDLDLILLHEVGIRIVRTVLNLPGALCLWNELLELLLVKLEQLFVEEYLL